jgi:hypothetical protein
MVWKSFIKSHSTRNNDIPPSTTNTVDWWIPNLKISTSGRLTADTVFEKGKMGVRLLLSRQVGWSAFGQHTIMDDNMGTLLKLQVTTCHNMDSMSSIQFQSVLERPIESTQLLLSHDHVHK